MLCTDILILERLGLIFRLGEDTPEPLRQVYLLRPSTWTGEALTVALMIRVGPR